MQEKSKTLFHSKHTNIGLSYIHYETVKDATNAFRYSKLIRPGEFNLHGSFRFFIKNLITIEPNVFFNIKENHTSKYLGSLFNISQRVWFGYTNIDQNDFQALYAGFDLCGRYRFGYNYSFSKKVGSERIKLHEIMFAIKLNELIKHDEGKE